MAKSNGPGKTKSKEAEELDEYLQKLSIAANKEPKEDEEAPPPMCVPARLPLQKVEHEPQKRGPTAQDLKKLINTLDAQTGKQLTELCVKYGLSQVGPRKKQIARLDKYLRDRYSRLTGTIGGIKTGGKTAKYFEYLVVMDFECTCEEVIIAYPHEIIEFPAVLVDVRQRKVVDYFRSYVRPKKNPILDQFCMQFTAISQSMVDSAPPFLNVVMSFQQWMQSKGLGTEGHRYAFVTDGPHDLWKFFQNTCIINNFEVPHEFRHFINIKKVFEMKYGHLVKGQGKPAIEMMCERLKQPLTGNKHVGLDDARNLANVVIRMLEDNVELRINAKFGRTKNFVMVDSELIDDIGRKDQAWWQNNLPLKLQVVKRDEFLSGAYLECESCDEKVENDTDSDD